MTPPPTSTPTLLDPARHDIALVGTIFEGQPFTRRMALGSGMTEHQFHQLRRSGSVRRVLRDVYVDAKSPDDTLSRAAAVALVLPDGAAIGRRTAAWLFGIDAWPLGQHQGHHPVECVVPRGTEPVRRPRVRCYASDLIDDDLIVVGPLRTTSPLRTAADLLRWLPPNLGLATADALAHARLVDPPEVIDALTRWRKHPGVAKARYLSRLIEPATESFGESMLRLRIVDAGLPRPTVQVEVVDRSGVVTWRLDLGWPDVLAAVEYDGEQHHSTPDQLRHDERRRAALSGLGWRVEVARKEHVLARSTALEWAVAAMLGLEPAIGRRRW